VEHGVDVQGNGDALMKNSDIAPLSRCSRKWRCFNEK